MIHRIPFCFRDPSSGLGRAVSPLGLSEDLVSAFARAKPAALSLHGGGNRSYASGET